MLIKEQYETLKKGLRNQCVWGYNHWNIWRQMNELVSKYNREINQSRAFYGMSLRAHESCFILQLTKLYDKSHARHVSLHSYLKFIAKNSSLFNAGAKEEGISLQQQIEDDQRKIKESGIIVKNIERWRNKNVAHIDKLYLEKPERVKEDYPVSIDEIENLYKLAGIILSRYSYYYDGIILEWKYMGWDDLESLLKFAKLGIEYQELKIEEEHNIMGKKI